MQPLLELPDQTSSNDIDEEIIDTFVEEVGEVLNEIVTSLNSWKASPEDTKSLKTLQRNFHTLKGSGRLVSAMVIGELGWKFENLLDRAIEGTIPPTNDAIFFLLEKVTNLLPNMVEQFKNHQPTPYEVRLLISQAHHLNETKGQSIGEFDLPGEEDKLETVTTQVPLTASEALKEPLPISGEGEETIEPKLFAIFNQEANQHLSSLKNALKRYEQILPIKQEIVRVFHTLRGSSLSVGFTQISNLATPLENYARALLERHTELTTDKLALFYQTIDMIEQLLASQTIAEDDQQALIDNIQTAVESLLMLPKIVSKSPEMTLQPAEPVVSDANFLDEAELPKIVNKSPEMIPPPAEPVVLDTTNEFVAIFLDEAGDILEKTQSLLQRWRATPDNLPLMKELQRELHTLKGGSRMVGMIAMGDLTHNLESILTRIVEGGAQSNPKLQESVQNSVDELAAMLEAARLEAQKPLNQEKQEEGPNQNLVKEKEGGKRVTLIDKLTNLLTNLVGELSISRAHLEQQQGSVKNNLAEMEQTVARLRDQLRRLEIETEAQILPHFKDTTKIKIDQEGFDPLELDRFSVMQQLSRSLLESISDLLNIQDALKILTRQTDSLLLQQTRMGAELHNAIVGTLMIPFSHISLRLQRIARSTARELEKPVDFIINGEQIEFEQTVLDLLRAPLEHMLRNAIAHGVEDASTRQQASKPAIAKITLDISKEGTELILKFSDDGGGLNLPAIRKKAEERGMIKPDAVISDDKLMQFILESGLSTAKEKTKIAGVGVGMDVVNSNIKDLRGSLHIHSKSGQGTWFEIRLPLSLTINQALLVHVGEETLAVPMNNVEAVMRASRTEVLGKEGEVRFYKYMGYDYQVYQLGELLGFGQLVTDKPLIPSLLVRVADRRMALLVDNIEGSKEIVVKSLDPKIIAIPWLAGATILGDGQVVLILDIPALTRINKELHYILPEPEPKPVAVGTIMVVDDSITVRKVTTRLLKRQGLEVLTAKDGIDALAQLQEQIPDLMLLDVEMPKMDGYELATQIRNTPDWKHIPIIMITSRTGAKHRDRAEKIGIDRYLGKPFNETELMENINALLNERASHRLQR